jgi:1-acyl-sn-glycerol-3-phosphate acyltransferase
VRVLITVPEAKAVALLLRARVATLGAVVTPAELAQDHGAFARPAVRASDLAFLQYTSGSTGNPKGVMLTHANLLANVRAMGRAARVDSTDVFVSWLPLYHDMGLIGAWFGSLYYAFLLVLMSPLSFLAHPERWLWAVYRHRGTLSAAPNFAYELCQRRIPEERLEGLDLSSWRFSVNGAEPVSPQTLTGFQERFAKYGLRPGAVAPVYGLAECSVGLAFSPPGRPPLIDRVRRDALMRDGLALPAAADDPAALHVVASGQPLPGHQIRIIDETGREVGDRREGTLQFRGPSTTSGYYRNPEETKKLFDGEWLNSGDLAYTVDGDIYITGRVKDVIIRAGRNLYPYELEQAVGNLEGIRRGCVAVFGCTDSVTGTERLVVLAETREARPEARQRLRQRIEELAVDLLGAPPEDVVLAPPHTVLKTSSGKIRRAACRLIYEQGQIGRPRSVWWQLARLALASLIPQARRTLRAAATYAYVAWWFTALGLLAPFIWTPVALLPGPWVWPVTRYGSRLFLWLTGMPARSRGREHLNPSRSCVYVVNHQSYMDALVVCATLPGRLRFVAKRELAEQFFTGRFLRSLGAEFVERFDRQRGLEDARRIARAAAADRPLVYFPEGTFSRVPGLQAFYMGAFVAAAEAGLPVVPVAIRGTRAVLRDSTWFPRRGRISVTILPPIAPDGTDWTAAIKLRDLSRHEMLRHCGEPDLAPPIEAA